ncbi:GATA zinc finger domain-containing protein 14-like [Pecten maximus]|uniref:GATA zinc finger domain-containing protein 14-like n=1 Tax=Pecten maximus TaxID=6579 RepID=UPI001459063D|nr:GATA zinc finger domain-containing protein 14-like [Pecten maximus]
MHAQSQQSHALEVTVSQNQASSPTRAVKRGKIKLHAEVNNKLIDNAMANSMRNHAPTGGMQHMFQFTSGGQFPPQQHFSRSQVNNAPFQSETQQSISSRVFQNVPNQNQLASSSFDFVNTVPPAQNSGKNSHVNPTKPAVNLQSPRPLPSPSLLEFVAQPFTGQPIEKVPDRNSQTTGNVATSNGVQHNARINSIAQVQSSSQKNSKTEHGFYQQPQSPGQSAMASHLSMIQQGISGQKGQTSNAERVQAAGNQGSMSANHQTDKRTPPPIPTIGQTTSPPILSPVYLAPQVTSSPDTIVKTNTHDLSILHQLVSASTANTTNQEPIAYQAPPSAMINQNNGQSATTGSGILQPIQVSGGTTTNNGQNAFLHPVTGTRTMEPVFASQSNAQSNSWTGNAWNQGSRTQNAISQIRATGELVPVFASEPKINNQNQQSNMVSGPSVSNQWHDMRSHWSSNGPQGFNIAAVPATKTRHETVQTVTTGSSTSSQDPAQAIFDAMFNKNNHKANIETLSASTGGQSNNIPGTAMTSQDLGPISAHTVGGSNSNNIGSISVQVSATSSQNGNTPSHTVLATRSHDPLMFGGQTISGEQPHMPGLSSSLNQQTGHIGHSSMMEATFQTPEQPRGQSLTVLSQAYLKEQSSPQQRSAPSSIFDAITNPHVAGQSTVPNSQNNGHVTLNQRSQSTNLEIQTTGTNNMAGNQNFQPAADPIEMAVGPVAHAQRGHQIISQNEIGKTGPQVTSNQFIIDSQRLNVINNQGDLGKNLHIANAVQPVHETQIDAVSNSLPSTNAMTFVNMHGQHSNNQVNNQHSPNSQVTNGLDFNSQQQNSGQQNSNQNAEFQQVNNHQTGNSQLNNNLQTVNSQLNNDFQTVNSQLNNNLQLVDSQGSNNLQTGNSQSTNNFQTGNGQLNNNFQTVNSQLNNDFQTGNGQLHNDFQTVNIQLNNNLQSVNSQLNNNLPSVNSHLNNEFQTVNSHLNNDFQTVNGQLNNDFQTVNSQLNNNLQTGNGQLHNDFQPVNSQLNNNLQPVDSHGSNNLQTGNSQSTNNFQTGNGQLHNDLQTVNSQLNNNLQPVDSQGSNNIQTGNSQSTNNFQTGNGQLNNDFQTVNSQLHNNFQTVNNQLNNNLQTEGIQLNTNEHNMHNHLNNDLQTMDSQLKNQQVDNQQLNSLHISNDPLNNNLQALNSNYQLNIQQNRQQIVTDQQKNAIQPLDNNPHVQQTVNSQSQSNQHVQQTLNGQSHSNEHMNSQQIANDQHQQFTQNQISKSQHMLKSESGQQVGASTNGESGVLSTLQQQGQQQPDQPSHSVQNIKAQTSATFVDIASPSGETNKSSLDKSSLHAKVKTMLDAGLSPDEILHIFKVTSNNLASSSL